MSRTANCLTFLFGLACVGSLAAQQPLGDWVFVPHYVLPGNAQNYPGPRIAHPASRFDLVEPESTPVLFHGERPTERLTGLIDAGSFPREAFSLELWLCQHVDRPVGVCMMIKGKSPTEPVPVSVGFHHWKTHLTMQGLDGSEVYLQHKMPEWGGFKQRWVHVVVVYDGHQARLVVNGEEMSNGHLHHDQIAWPSQAEFEIAAYMKNEPYMQTANLLHSARVYDRALSDEAIQNRLKQLQTQVHKGHLYPELFHFTAGPYLNFVTTTGVNVLWETERPAKATIEWGTSAKLENQREIADLARKHEFTLSQLAPDTPYFYRITCTAADGSSIDSGLLTFKTAVRSGQPFRFAIIGDTESRPHINNRIAKRIWAERPHFVVNLGDLTDAGNEPHRYEWTHEYFVGMTQLVSRVPMFAVPGNGESDLMWYKHYHAYPNPEGYYAFRYGNAAFFMLDSNQREREFAPGGRQYEWLEQELAACDAEWKFVCHHHATYTGEENDYGDSWSGAQHFGDPFVRKIVPLYEKYGVDIAMFGHLHLYERSHPIRDGKVDAAAGTIHLLAGGGGGNLEDFAPTPAFFSAKTYPDHHYLTMEIFESKLSMRMMGLDGAVRDWLVVDKGVRSGSLKVCRQTKPKN